MRDETKQPDRDWEPCPAGKISGLVGKIKGRRRMSALMEFGGGTILGILVAVVSYQYINLGSSRTDFHYGGVSCTQVQAKATDYLNDKLTPLVRVKFDLHLKACPTCSPIFAKLQNGQSTSHRHDQARPVRVHAQTHQPRYEQSSPLLDQFAESEKLLATN